MTAPTEIAEVIAGERRRIPRDGYFTPESCAAAIAKRVATLALPSPRRICEPSSGGGAFVHAAREVWTEAAIVGVDISPTAEIFARSAGADFFCTDFLRYEPGEPFDLVLGNPPFDDAEAHVRHALEIIRPGGFVALLLRLAFVASDGRMRGICSGSGRYVAPIAPRPSFTGGGNDNSEYALFVWSKGAAWGARLGEPLFWDKPRRAAK